MGMIAAALFPIAALIALGRLMRARGWVEDSFWPGAERLTYTVLLPALLVASLAKAKLGGLPVTGMVAALVGGQLLMAGGIVLASRALTASALGLDGPGLTSVFQCSLRPNTYVGLAVASGLWGGQGVALTAVGLAAVIPLVNFLCVLALLRWAGPPGTSFRWRAAALPIAKNPLILSCGLGIALNTTGIGLPAVLDPLFAILAGASLPLGLMAVGAGLDMGTIRTAGRAVALATALKMGLMPLLVLGLGVMVGLGGLPLAASVVYAALPAAPASYILARQMGGDATLVAATLSAQTLAAALVLPLWLWSLHLP